jgi:serine/threonine-protein kinase
VLPLTKRDGAATPAEPARFEPRAGMVVADKYRVERVIGEGGMGLVVAATHIALEQPVAIKFLLPEAMRSSVAVERFLREARVAAKVRSEHVTRVHDVGTLDGGVPYIVMELLVGSDLGQLIAANGALPIEEACEIAFQACEALAEVHAAGIVHRDLKPSNLFVTRRADGSPAVKLLDFGISKLTFGGDDGADPALTATATIMGSPSYMSPEQLKSTKEVDPRTDVWSLGAVLYEALTGKAAFRGESVPQVCAMIASEDPPLPSALRDGIPLDLERAVLACLRKSAAQRISLIDLAHALAQFGPDRTRPSLERIQAVLGAPSRSRVDFSGTRERDPLPVLPLATSERNGTVSSWGGKDRGRSGSGALAMLLFGVIGVLAFALYTGRVTVNHLRGDIAGAASVVGSAASAVSSAMASGLPAMPPLPSIPLPSALPSLPSLPVFDDTNADAGADNEATEEDDEEDDAAAAVPPAHAASATGATHPPAPRPHASPKKHLTKPLHHRHS